MSWPKALLAGAVLFIFMYCVAQGLGLGAR